MIKPISLRAYAKLRGVSPEAVSKAIADGRLSESVVRVDGAPKIADTAIADREWDANTRPRVDREAPGPRAASDYHAARASREAALAKREAAQATLAELELAEKRGQLVLAKDVETRLVDVFTSCRTRLLGIPARVRQRDPTVTAKQLALFGDLIREALEDLASGKGPADGI